MAISLINAASSALAEGTINSRPALRVANANGKLPLNDRNSPDNPSSPANS